MSEVTDADRKKAVALLRAASADDLIHPVAAMAQPLMVDRVAAALAEEREKARAPFLALADDIESRGRAEIEAMNAEPSVIVGSSHSAAAGAYARAAFRIRQAAGMTTTREETP